MISVIHAPADEFSAATDDYPVHAVGRRIKLDWDRVAESFREAVARVGWDADVELRPDKQYALVRFAAGSPELIAGRMDAFYDVIEDAIGAEAFMSIWIDFTFLP